LFCCKMATRKLKNNKIKKSEIGSEVTIHRRGKRKGLNISPISDDLKHTSQIARCSNPGGAILKMEEEFIEEIDFEGNIIATHPKNLLKEKMFTHKVVLILPKTKDNKIILSKRAKDKHPFPGIWCCAVGRKVSTGETEEQAALREMQEEIGVIKKITKVTSFNYDKEDYNGMFTIFTSEISLDELTPDTSEIEYLKDFHLDEIKDLIEKSPEEFAPTFIVAIKKFLSALNKTSNQQI
ncbi:MAG: NUDIX domain-containing protein, partial [archaeon]